jgi:selenide,water dikinase
LESDPTEREKAILCDPQTSGGLLVAVEKKASDAFLELAGKHGLNLKPIGTTIPRRGDKAIILI